MVGPLPAATLAGRAGDAALRVGAGGVTGGAMAGLVNPDEAGTGAMIGAALPPAVATAGKVGSLIGQAGRSVGSNVLGAATGTGSDAIRTAYNSGKTGATAFLDNMRGNSQFDDIVGHAKQGLAKMRADRGAQYRSGMVDIKADKSILDMTPIQNAMSKVSSMGSFKGKQINKNAAGVVDDLRATIDDCRGREPENLDPGQPGVDPAVVLHRTGDQTAPAPGAFLGVYPQVFTPGFHDISASRVSTVAGRLRRSDIIHLSELRKRLYRDHNRMSN